MPETTRARYIALKKYLDSLWDLVFPQRCAGCGRLGIWLCPFCEEKLSRITPPICPHCGLPSLARGLCLRCRTGRSYVKGIRSPYYFEGPLKEIVYRFKYRRAKHLAEPLGQLLVDYLVENCPPDVDAVVPVPLHTHRFQERGYNQSALLAEHVSTSLGFPLVVDCVERVRDTAIQMSLPAIDRPGNVRGAFRMKGQRLEGATVLLVDDVCTTGSTIEACATALKEAGAKRIWALTLARGRSPRA